MATIRRSAAKKAAIKVRPMAAKALRQVATLRNGGARRKG
jgi:hypothetical protein